MADVKYWKKNSRMELPAIDFNAVNLRWADRIFKENKINARLRSPRFDYRKETGGISSKISTIPPPRERERRVLEFMRLKEASSAVNAEFTFHVSSPRHSFLLPQV